MRRTIRNLIGGLLLLVQPLWAQSDTSPCDTLREPLLSALTDWSGHTDSARDYNYSVFCSGAGLALAHDPDAGFAIPLRQRLLWPGNLFAITDTGYAPAIPVSWPEALSLLTQRAVTSSRQLVIWHKPILITGADTSLGAPWFFLSYCDSGATTTIWDAADFRSQWWRWTDLVGANTIWPVPPPAQRPLGRLALETGMRNLVLAARPDSSGHTGFGLAALARGVNRAEALPGDPRELAQIADLRGAAARFLAAQTDLWPPRERDPVKLAAYYLQKDAEAWRTLAAARESWDSYDLGQRQEWLSAVADWETKAAVALDGLLTSSDKGNTCLPGRVNRTVRSRSRANPHPGSSSATSAYAYGARSAQPLRPPRGMKSTIAVLLRVSIMVACLPAVVPRAQTVDFRVNSDRGTAYQGYSACAAAADGFFAVVWEDARVGGVDIYIQCFDSAGTRLGIDRAVNDTVLPDQYAPAVTADPSGNFWVVWQDFRVSGYPQNGDVYLQRVMRDGTRLGVNLLVNDDGLQVTQKEPALACNAAEILIVWSDLRRGEWDIYGQRFDLIGNPLGANFRLNDEVGPAPQHAPTVAADGSGRFVVAWYDTRSGDEDLFYQVVAAAGGGLEGVNLPVDGVGDGFRQRFPTIAPGPDGGFTVAWEDFRTGIYPDGGRIYTRAFRPDGTPTTLPLPAAASASDQRKPRLVGDAAANRVLVWEEERLATWSIFGLKLKASEDTTTEVVSIGSDSATAARTRPGVSIGRGRLFYTWTDLRNGDFDIYMAIESYRFPSFIVSPPGIAFQAPPRAPELAVPLSVVALALVDPAPRVRWEGLPTWLEVAPLTAQLPDTFIFTLHGPLPALDTTLVLQATSELDSTERQDLGVALTLIWPVIAAEPALVKLQTKKKKPESTAVRIYAAEGGPLDWDFIAPSAPWQARRVGADSLWVLFDPAGLTDSTWEDTLWIHDSLAGNNPLAIPLTSSASSVGAAPLLTANPPALVWLAELGSASRDSVQVTLATAEDTVLLWTLTNCPDWLYLNSDSGALPATVTLRPAWDTLPLGVYEDTLYLNAAAAINSPLAIPVTLTVDIQSEIAGPDADAAVGPSLYAYPNPFNHNVLVVFGGTSGESVALAVYDILGRAVAAWEPAVIHATPVYWRWSPGSALASGHYFITVSSGDRKETVRVVYLK